MGAPFPATLDDAARAARRLPPPLDTTVAWWAPRGAERRRREQPPDQGPRRRVPPMTKAEDEEERRSTLAGLEEWLERPMWLLAFVWLALLVLELTTTESRVLTAIGTGIWIVFVLEFLLKVVIAPRKLEFLGRNWLTVLSLLVPALRLLRVGRALLLLRASRAARGARLLRVVGSINRGMRALRASMARRGLGYVFGSTVIVLFGGATGMYALESGEHAAFASFGGSLWWTAMILTTMGSEAWPQSPEGRLLCLFLAVYAFAVFGYVTAAIATYFVGRDAENEEGELVGQAQLKALRQEIAALRADLRGTVEKPPTG